MSDKPIKKIVPCVIRKVVVVIVATHHTDTMTPFAVSGIIISSSLVPMHQSAVPAYSMHIVGGSIHRCGRWFGIGTDQSVAVVVKIDHLCRRRVLFVVALNAAFDPGLEIVVRCSNESPTAYCYGGI